MDLRYNKTFVYVNVGCKGNEAGEDDKCRFNRGNGGSQGAIQKGGHAEETPV